MEMCLTLQPSVIIQVLFFQTILCVKPANLVIYVRNIRVNVVPSPLQKCTIIFSYNILKYFNALLLSHKTVYITKNTSILRIYSFC